MSTSYTCDQTALLKILLHAAKYPAAAVNGVLLGRISSDQRTVQVVDAIPLLHSFLTLAPALETALIQVRYDHAGHPLHFYDYLSMLYAHNVYMCWSQVSSYAKQQKGLQLMGYYHANERFDDTELGSSAQKVADKLHSQVSVACALLVRLSMLMLASGC